MPPQIECQITTFSHIGKREENQDRYNVFQSPDQQRQLFVVADGMGGHKGGSLAAQTIIDTANKLWQGNVQQESCDIESAEAFLHELIKQSHLAVNAAGEAEGLEPRSTIAALYLFEEAEHYKAISIHAGDSRITQYSSSERITQSIDHSLAQLKVLRGKITEAEMANDPDQSKVISNIGGQDLPDPEITHWDLARGGRFTVCSDGFWEVFDTQETLKIFESSLEQREALIETVLLDKMQERPKHDNTTVLMIEIDKSN